MAEPIRTEKILFLDIETVPACKEYQQLSEPFKEFWDKKSKYFREANQTSEEVYNRAGIYAEFGKIICISFGMFFIKDDQRGLRVKSVIHDDEKQILTDFIDILKKTNTQHNLMLCGHNGKEFDFPYIARRILINNIKLPSILDVSGKKPWETAFLDTLEMWKFGDYKHYTSLDLLAHLFNIPSPKSDIDGSKVAEVYYNDHDLTRISTYCQNDVITVAQLYLAFKGEPIIADHLIERVE